MCYWTNRWANGWGWIRRDVVFWGVLGVSLPEALTARSLCGDFQPFCLETVDWMCLGAVSSENRTKIILKFFLLISDQMGIIMPNVINN